MSDLLRDAPIGQFIRWASNKKYLRYPDEEPGFQIPKRWTTMTKAATSKDDFASKADSALSSPRSDRSASWWRISMVPYDFKNDFFDSYLYDDDEKALRDSGSMGSILMKRPASTSTMGNVGNAEMVVDWYDDQDADNPQNWSDRKRALVTVIICLYTFVVYTSSAIYVSSTQGVMDEFHVSQLSATLGLSLYVLGYGVGPLIFSPLGEMPTIGRNPVYIVTMALFVIVSLPTAFAPDLASLIVLRFLQGFFGSPCLASGGATLADMYSMNSLPYAMLAWVSASYCGPALGPLLSGFSVPAKNWRWSLYETIWAAAPIFIMMFMFLPETSSEKILRDRAARVSKIVGKELMVAGQTVHTSGSRMSRVVDALVKPIEISFKDPAVLFVQMYTSIIYGIYYSFFEVFPLVYGGFYKMSLGQMGIVFLCILVACIIGVIAYSTCLYCMGRQGFSTPEKRLVPALGACFGPTIGLFLFAWTARESIHFIVPTLGITIYGSTVFIVFQCLFIYIPLTYPKYAASLFAANDFFRSALACGSVLIAHPLFTNLGVAKGVSVLGGLSVIGIIGIWLLFLFGARLRAMSTFADMG